MNRLALIVVLGLLSGTTHGTFELEDPAAEIFEELQASRELQEMQAPEKEIFCVMDTDTNECFCIHKETRQVLSIAHNECVVRVSKPVIQEP